MRTISSTLPQELAVQEFRFWPPSPCWMREPPYRLRCLIPKEVTGSLDDNQLRTLSERLIYLERDGGSPRHHFELHP